jgi:hypothetical protein
MKEVEEIKKIRRLSYVIILTILSYYIFLTSYPKDNLLGKQIYKYFYSINFEPYFKLCLKQKYLELLIDRQCSGREKSIKINNVVIYPKLRIYDQKQSEELEKFNSDPKNRYEYKYDDNQFEAHDKAIKITEIFMWLIFLLSLPIIWLSRDLSIYGITIINKVVKIISKGWNKI